MHQFKKEPPHRLIFVRVHLDPHHHPTKDNSDYKIA